MIIEKVIWYDGKECKKWLSFCHLQLHLCSGLVFGYLNCIYVTPMFQSVRFYYLFQWPAFSFVCFLFIWIYIAYFEGLYFVPLLDNLYIDQDRTSVTLVMCDWRFNLIILCLMRICNWWLPHCCCYSVTVVQILSLGSVGNSD